MAEHGLDGLTYGHFGDGCVHVRIDFPFASAPGRYRRFVVAAAQLVGRYGGSMSGEHGDGRARSELLPAMYSPEAIDVFAAVKAIFDPGNVLNPGVLVDPAPLDADLRVPLARPLRRGLGFAYSHDGGDLSTAVHRCIGVGKCRADTTGSGGVMCPSYLATRDEKDSTRGRARVLQELANGRLVKGFRSAEVAESLDLCLSCKGCSSDCPAGVDMATYKAEVLYQRYRRRLRPPAHYSLGWLPRWARLASRAPGLANAALRAPGLAGPGQAAGRDRRPAAAAAVRRADLPRLVRPRAGTRRRAPAPRCCCGWTRSPTTSRPRSARPRCGCWRRPGTRCRSPPAGVLRADLDLHRPAGRRPPAAAAQPRALWPGARRGHPDRRAGALVHRRAPRRDHRAAARRPAGPAGPRRHPHAGRAAGRHRPVGAAGPRRRARGGPAALPPPCRDGLARRLRAAGPGRRRGQRGRRLLRAGRQLRRRARPLRRLAGGGRDRAAARRPRGRAADAVVLADGFSCRTQLDQLAQVRGIHLAQLLASRLEGPPVT